MGTRRSFGKVMTSRKNAGHNGPPLPDNVIPELAWNRVNKWGKLFGLILVTKVSVVQKIPNIKVRGFHFYFIK